MSESKFCIQKVAEHFEKCLSAEDDISMDDYLAAYIELSKFFSLMGKVFGFVSSDVNEKIKILEAFRLGDEKIKFETFKTMMEHEKNEKLLDKKAYVSGSRTLLRLHRGMGMYKECRRLNAPIRSRAVITIIWAFVPRLLTNIFFVSRLYS